MWDVTVQASLEQNYLIANAGQRVIGIQQQICNIHQRNQTRQQRCAGLPARKVCGISTEEAGSQRALLMVLRKIARQSTNLFKPMEIKSRESEFACT